MLAKNHHSPAQEQEQELNKLEKIDMILFLSPIVIRDKTINVLLRQKKTISPMPSVSSPWRKFEF